MPSQPETLALSDAQASVQEPTPGQLPLQAPAALEKRTWHYLQPPSTFDIAPCDCGNVDTQWSEYAQHLWCARCEKDFIPKDNGLFGGPISSGIAKLFGIRFDRYNMETKKVELFNTTTLQYEEKAV